MAETTNSSGERPISGLAKLLLVLGATGAIGLCYLFSAVSMVLLLLLLAVEALLLIAAARFGLAGHVAKFMQRHAALLAMFVRSLWLRKGTDYRVTIEPPDAPRLFALLQSLASRLGIQPPHEVSIEMNAGAWVRLRGYRRGAGRTILGLGYDLLAGLSVGEVEAVMAHEMTHAKLVQRGLKQVLNAGVGRVSTVAGQLQHEVDAYRQAGERFELAEMFLRVADGLTGLAARWVGRYSRQDEFEADRGAAELCGAEPLRTSLCRLEAMGDKLGRLPWTERVARLETEASFSRWLSEELAVTAEASSAAAAEEVRDPYSTHPSLRDRIAALPPIAYQKRDDTPGIALLAEPDRVASRLMQEIQRVLAEQEQKDTKSLAKWAKKAQGGVRIRAAQLPGLVLTGLGLFLAIILFAEFNFATLLISVGLIAGGVAAWRWGRYKDKRELPVPGFGDIKRSWEAKRPDDLSAQEKAIEAELRAKLTGRRRSQIALLLDEAYAALVRCEYLRAHVAARLTLDRDDKSIEAGSAMAVAAAGLGLSDQMGQMLFFLRQQTGLSTPQTTWCAAWALVLVGDWQHAEAFLWRRHCAQPDNATFLALLALAQSQRNKLQGAVANAQRALALAPGELEHAKLLARILLDAGRLREAGALLQQHENAAHADAALAMSMVQLRLLRREYAAAAEWAAVLRAANASTAWVIRLGENFETARRDEEAARLYDEALALGHYPEAHLGLARLAGNRRDKERARHHLLSAIDLDKKLGENAAGPLLVFQRVLAQLFQLEEPRANCRALIARFNATAAPGALAALANRDVMVYAADRAAAEKYLDVVLRAMHPNSPPASTAALMWRDAPRDQQPVRPVRPGVQCVL